METWWKRWWQALSRAAVPVDGDPGAWRIRSDAGRRSRRRGRPGRLEACVEPSRRIASSDTIERSLWRDVHLPPPAA